MFKGKCHEMDIFFEGLNILISTYCVCADFFQGFSKAFRFLSASLKLLTNLENAYWNPPQNSLLSDWSMFSSSDLSLLIGCRENAQELTCQRQLRYDFTE